MPATRSTHKTNTRSSARNQGHTAAVPPKKARNVGSKGKPSARKPATRRSARKAPSPASGGDDEDEAIPVGSDKDSDVDEDDAASKPGAEAPVEDEPATAPRAAHLRPVPRYKGAAPAPVRSPAPKSHAEVVRHLEAKRVQERARRQKPAVPDVVDDVEDEYLMVFAPEDGGQDDDDLDDFAMNPADSGAENGPAGDDDDAGEHDEDEEGEKEDEGTGEASVGEQDAAGDADDEEAGKEEGEYDGEDDEQDEGEQVLPRRLALPAGTQAKEGGIRRRPKVLSPFPPSSPAGSRRSDKSPSPDVASDYSENERAYTQNQLSRAPSRRHATVQEQEDEDEQELDAEEEAEARRGRPVKATQGSRGGGRQVQEPAQRSGTQPSSRRRGQEPVAPPSRGGQLQKPSRQLATQPSAPSSGEEEQGEGEADEEEDDEASGYAPGPLSKAVGEKAVALYESYCNGIHDLAQEHEKNPKTLFRYVGDTISIPRKENDWNIYQRWYAVKGDLKKPDNVAVGHWTQLVKQTYARLLESPDYLDKIAEIREWYANMLGGVLESKKDRNKHSATLTGVVKTFVDLSNQTRNLQGYHIFGFAISTERDSKNASPSVMWGGSPEFAAMKARYQERLMVTLTDMESLIRVEEMGLRGVLPEQLKLQAELDVFKLRSGEHPRDRLRRIIALTLVRDINNSVATKDEVKSMPWKSWSDFAWQHKLCLYNWPAGVPPPGDGFNIKSAFSKTKQLENIAASIERALVCKAEGDEEGEEDARKSGIIILTWEDDQAALPIERMWNLPLVMDTNLRKIMGAQHSKDYVQALDAEEVEHPEPRPLLTRPSVPRPKKKEAVESAGEENENENVRQEAEAREEAGRKGKGKQRVVQEDSEATEEAGRKSKRGVVASESDGGSEHDEGGQVALASGAAQAPVGPLEERRVPALHAPIPREVPPQRVLQDGFRIRQALPSPAPSANSSAPPHLHLNTKPRLISTPTMQMSQQPAPVGPYAQFSQPYMHNDHPQYPASLYGHTPPYDLREQHQVPYAAAEPYHGSPHPYPAAPPLQLPHLYNEYRYPSVRSGPQYPYDEPAPQHHERSLHHPVYPRNSTYDFQPPSSTYANPPQGYRQRVSSADYPIGAQTHHPETRDKRTYEEAGFMDSNGAGPSKRR